VTDQKHVEIVYTGPHPSVTVDRAGVRFEQGKPQKVRAAVAERLLQQETFEKATTPAPAATTTTTTKEN
jgi:hypothetical protein